MITFHSDCIADPSFMRCTQAQPRDCGQGPCHHTPRLRRQSWFWARSCPRWRTNSKATPCDVRVKSRTSTPQSRTRIKTAQCFRQALTPFLASSPFLLCFTPSSLPPPSCHVHPLPPPSSRSSPLLPPLRSFPPSSSFPPSCFQSFPPSARQHISSCDPRVLFVFRL